LSRTSYGYKNQGTWKVRFYYWGRFCFRFHHEISGCEYTGRFSLRGKPLNSYGMNKKLFMKMRNSICYRPLDIEDDMEICVTIILWLQRMPMSMECTFACYWLLFSYNFPWLIKMDICIFTNTTFQSTKQKETIYCYSDEERKALKTETKTRNHPI
jgi:topoisomerase-4 subunit B